MTQSYLSKLHFHLISSHFWTFNALNRSFWPRDIWWGFFLFCKSFVRSWDLWTSFLLLVHHHLIAAILPKRCISYAKYSFFSLSSCNGPHQWSLSGTYSFESSVAKRCHSLPIFLQVDQVQNCNGSLNNLPQKNIMSFHSGQCQVWNICHCFFEIAYKKVIKLVVFEFFWPLIKEEIEKLENLEEATAEETITKRFKMPFEN